MFGDYRIKKAHTCDVSVERLLSLQENPVTEGHYLVLIFYRLWLCFLVEETVEQSCTHTHTQIIIHETSIKVTVTHLAN